MEKEKEIDVLFVEDSLDDSEFTEFAIAQASDKIKFRHFKDGEEALNFIYAKDKFLGQRTHTGLKFVILDIGLPTINGLEVLRRIRAEKTTRRLPVIILSSSKDHDHIEVAYHLGANSYVIKPNDFDRYIKKVGSLAHYWSSINEKLN